MVETLKYEALGTNVVINPPERKIIRSYEEREKPTPQVSFAKPSQEVTSEGVKHEETEAPLTRTERASQFRRARDIEKRAMEMKKQAEQQFDQAKGFQQLMQEARKDPTVLAKAMGMEPNEFLRQYQNQMFNIKDEPEPVKPEEEIKQRLDRYEAERVQERRMNQEIQSQTVKQTYVSTKILPALDNEEFELIHLQGSKEEIGGFIYDIMDDHFRKTNEELDPKEVAEEMEKVLLADYESKVQGVRKAKKLSKYFVPEEQTGQLGGGPGRNEVRTKPSPLGTRTLSSRLENPNMSTGEPTRAAFMSREERLNKILSKY